MWERLFCGWVLGGFCFLSCFAMLGSAGLLAPSVFSEDVVWGGTIGAFLAGFLCGFTYRGR
jgi:hypothetical protein